MNSYLPLKSNWFHILAVLSGGERHGYAIMREVEERTQGRTRLWPATLYGSIRRMLGEGLITASETPDEEDPRRRYYRITSKGRGTLAAEVQRLRSLVAMVESIPKADNLNG